MNYLRSHVFKNPVLAERRRLAKRFFSLGLGKTNFAWGGRAALVAIYVLLFLVFPKDQAPTIQLVITLLAVGLVLLTVFGFYAAIAGERDRGTWDLLRSSPITPSQIVLGKFLSGAYVVLLVWAAALPFVYLSYLRTDYAMLRKPPVANVVLAALLCLATALLSLTITLLFSARCRTTLTSLSTSLTTFAGWLWALYLAISALTSLPLGNIAMLTLNPVLCTSLLCGPPRDFGQFTPYYAKVMLVVVLILTVFAVIWTASTLTYAEEHVGFVEKQPNALPSGGASK